MKVLLINKYHYLKGGAERAYFDTARILTDHGHEVAFFSMHHPQNKPTYWSKYFIDEVDYESSNMPMGKKIKTAVNIFWNWQASRNLESMLREFKPDIAHLHNIYHQLSPSIIRALKKHGIPVVMTLHDYKLISPNYHLLVRGQIWEKTKNNNYYHCLADKCVKDSYLKSITCTIEAYLHRMMRIYDKVDLYISPSQFLINKFKEFGFNNEIFYLPNPLLDKPVNHGINNPIGAKFILYFGRLSEEKGIDDLIKAYSPIDTEIKLLIVGDGPQMKNLKLEITNLKLENKIIFAGHKSGAELDSYVQFSEFVVAPSKWYENAPYSVIEAMAAAKTVICTDIGGLPEMVIPGQTGFLFKPGDISELKKIISDLINNPELYNLIGQQAKISAIQKHNTQEYYKKLLNYYDQARREIR